jgi:hypothetical protein
MNTDGARRTTRAQPYGLTCRRSSSAKNLSSGRDRVIGTYKMECARSDNQELYLEFI